MHPWLQGIYSFPTGILLSCCKSDLLKYTVPGLEHTPLEERKRWEFWSALFYCEPISSLLTVLPLLVNMYGMHNQVRLPLLTARWARNTYSVFHWYDHWGTVCVPCTARRVLEHTQKSSVNPPNKS